MPQPIALRVVTDACQMIWQYYLPDAFFVVHFASWSSFRSRTFKMADDVNVNNIVPISFDLH